MITNPKQNKEQGIVLVEAIIAVGVLVTIFTASLALYLGSIGGMRMSNDQLIATYLAQDGLEQVIAKRQYNFESDRTWLNGIPVSTSCMLDYYNDTIDASLASCTGDGCRLFSNPTTGIFSHDNTSNESYFNRSVEVTTLPGDVEARVVVTVTWKDKDDTFSVSLTHVLYNNPNNNLTIP
jgi:Tfp pilus assembly protein PilV